MPLVPFVAGQDLTAAALNAAFDVTRTAYQADQQTVISSTTFVSSTALVLPVAASSGYVFESEIFCTSGATPDIKIKLLLPAGSTVRWNTDSNSTTTSTEIVFSTTGSTQSFKPSGFINIDTASGNLTLQFAQNTSNATNTVLEVGSWIRLTKVTP